MEGYLEPTRAVPGDEAGYRAHESRGCPEFPLKLELDVSVENLDAFFRDERHRMQLDGTVTLRLPGAEREVGSHARGWLELLVPADDPTGSRGAEHRGARPSPGPRLAALPDDGDRSRQRLMTYALSFSDASRQEWWIVGHKRIGAQPGVDAWRATTSLYCRLQGPFPRGTGPPASGHASVCAAGVVHVDLATFLYRQIPSMRVSASRPLRPAGVGAAASGDDPARTTWALLRFASFFFGSLQRIYMPEIGSALDAAIRGASERRPHPLSPREVDFGQRAARS
jgi:hypothetical protein